MGYHKKSYAIGDIVYESFSPNNAGKVVDIIDSERVRVRWIHPKGKRVRVEGNKYGGLRPAKKHEKQAETEERTRNLCCLEWLIADHEQKTKTHKTTLAKAKAL